VTGHAVRALYLAAGVTELYLETGEEALVAAVRAQWRDMAGRKTYLTGAVGAHHAGEAFPHRTRASTRRAAAWRTSASRSSTAWRRWMRRPAPRSTTFASTPPGPSAEMARPDLLGGIVVVEAAGAHAPAEAWNPGWHYAPAGNAPPAAGRRVNLLAVPYALWGNRGSGAMRVWIPLAGDPV
jgi:DUF1680 family protein